MIVARALGCFFACYSIIAHGYGYSARMIVRLSS